MLYPRTLLFIHPIYNSLHLLIPNSQSFLPLLLPTWHPQVCFLSGCGLPSMGSHRVRHNWSDLAAVAAPYKTATQPHMPLQVITFWPLPFFSEHLLPPNKCLFIGFFSYTRMQINGRIFVLVYPQQLNQSLPDEEAQVNSAKVTQWMLELEFVFTWSSIKTAKMIVCDKVNC